MAGRGEKCQAVRACEGSRRARDRLNMRAVYSVKEGGCLEGRVMRRPSHLSGLVGLVGTWGLVGIDADALGRGPWAVYVSAI
eukprot:5644832-Pyramimonas_sp.AAC.1